MPCKKCKDGKYKWGNTGECKYATKDECEKANPKNYKQMKEYPTPLGKKTYEEYAKELKEYNLSKVEKIELGLVDDLKKSNTEGKKIAASVLKEGEKIAKLYDSIRDEVSSYTKLNDAYEKEIKKAKDSWKKHGDIMDDILLQSNELGIKALDIPQYKEAVGVSKELRVAGNDTVRYPSIKL